MGCGERGGGGGWCGRSIMQVGVGLGAKKKPKTSLWGLVLGWIWVGDGAAASYGAKQPPTIIS